MRLSLLVMGVLFFIAWIFTRDDSFFVATQVWLAASVMNSLKDD